MEELQANVTTVQANVNTLGQLQNDLQQQVNIQNALLLHLQQNQQGPPQQQEVVNELKKIVTSLVTSQVIAGVTPYKGETKDFKRWVRDIERHVRAIAGNDESRISVATQTSQGIVAYFLFRYRNDHGHFTWQELKDELSNRFGDIVDASTALTQLRRMKQNSGESVTVFAERILDKASDAYPEEPLDEPLISRQLVDIYVDGLQEPFVARKIMRDDPQNFQAAVNLAVKETRLTKKFALRKRLPGESSSQRHTPMEVDSLEQNPSINKGVAQLQSHDCPVKNHMGRYEPRWENFHRPAFRGQCFTCGSYGHMARECLAVQKDAGRGNGKGDCFTCGRPGHFARDCPARYNGYSTGPSGNAMKGPAFRW